jgi:hypothetical protein
MLRNQGKHTTRCGSNDHRHESFLNEDGIRVFNLDCVVNCERRPPSNAQNVGNQAVDGDGSGENNEEDLDAQHAGAQTEDGLVRDAWRLISAVKAWPTTDWFLPQLVDYSHEGGRVIRQAVALINKSLPDVTWDHSDSSRDVAGHVEKAYWEKSSDIPPGVNGTLVVDPEYDSKAAKGLQNKTIRNGSIGLRMQVKQSHEDMDKWDFLEKQGQIVNGEEVRWLPVKVATVQHMAFVPAGLGADPNAGRREKQQNATQHNSYHHNGHKGERGMEKLMAFIATFCQALGLEESLSAGSEIPPGLEDRVINQVSILAKAQQAYNQIVAQLQAIGQSLLHEGATSLTVAQTLERLPGFIAMAKHGKSFLEHRRKEALEWFDKAKVEPNVDMSDTAKRLRKRIEETVDLDFIEDSLEDYKAQAEKRYGTSNRSSTDPPLNDGKTEQVPIITGRNRDIVDGAKRLSL